MRLFRGKIETIAQQIVTELTKDGELETDNPAEVQLDVEAVLKEYLRQERDIVDEAKNRLEIRGLSYSMLGKVKHQIAKERSFSMGEEMLPYLLQQILTMLFHSQNVEEIYADDIVLRKKMTAILRRNLDLEGALDKEVRSKIKNLEEGTATFEIEYARMMERIKAKKRLT